MVLFIVYLLSCFFFFKQKTAYELRISDWSSDVCSFDLQRSTLHIHRHRNLPVFLGQIGFKYPPRFGRLKQCVVKASGREQQCCLDRDRKSVVEGKSVSVRVDLGGRRIIKKTKSVKEHESPHNYDTRNVEITGTK